MNKKHILYIICVLFVVVTGIVYYLKNYYSGDEILLEDVMQESAITVTEDISDDGSETENDEQNEDTEESTSKEKLDAEYIYVHICGAISKPGVYRLEATSRVVDVINMAGGLTSKADSVAVNQAKILSDSEQIYIPKKGEKLTDNNDSDEKSNDEIRDESSVDSNVGTSTQKKVNINSASKSDLITLPGIGEAKADMIIQYRNKNGSFSKIEDIMNITGIKEGLFNKISEYITV